MRSIVVTITAVILLICIIPITDVSAADDDPLILYEVMPLGAHEGFTLYNSGSSGVNLSQYTVTDLETNGTVTFSPISLASKATITVLSGTPPAWIDAGRDVHLSGDGVTIGSGFALADAGDDIYLKKGSKTVDTFVYGNRTTTDGWSGDVPKRLPSGSDKIYQRISFTDTDTAKDWVDIIPGADLFAPFEYTGNIIPFLLPESNGAPVFKALQEAKNEILISVYMLDHPGIVNILLELIERPVNPVTVKIFLEGYPTGDTVPDNEIAFMNILEDADPSEDNVFFIYNNNNTDKYRRYDYVHNKYAVIDSEVVILTTENWRTSSFTSNRGWGVVVRSPDYAEYMRNIFFEDIDDGHGDIFTFDERYPEPIIKAVPLYTIPTGTYTEYNNITFKTAITPYYGYDLLNEMLEGAEDRIYAELLSLSSSWVTGNTPLTRLFDASANGLDVRMILDDTYDSAKDPAVKNFIKNSLNGKILAKAGSEGTFTSQIHNKGVIIDDSVWIGSMNWNDNSMKDNRETGLIIFSEEITAVYANAFFKDWGAEDVFEGTIDIQVDVPSEIKANGAFVLDASGTYAPAGAIYRWDVDGDGDIDFTGKKIVAELPAGEYECKLYITDTATGVNEVHIITLKVDDGAGIPAWMYISAGALVLLLIVIKMILGSKSKPSKKSSGKSSGKSKGKKK